MAEGRTAEKRKEKHRTITKYFCSGCKQLIWEVDLILNDWICPICEHNLRYDFAGCRAIDNANGIME